MRCNTRTRRARCCQCRLVNALGSLMHAGSRLDLAASCFTSVSSASDVFTATAPGFASNQAKSVKFLQWNSLHLTPRNTVFLATSVTLLNPVSREAFKLKLSPP